MRLRRGAVFAARVEQADAAGETGEERVDPCPADAGDAEPGEARGLGGGGADGVDGKAAEAEELGSAVAQRVGAGQEEGVEGGLLGGAPLDALYLEQRHDERLDPERGCLGRAVARPGLGTRQDEALHPPANNRAISGGARFSMARASAAGASWSVSAKRASSARPWRPSSL